MSDYPLTAKSLLDSWLTIKLLAKAEPSFTEPAIRNLVFHAEDRQSSIGIILGNGLAPSIRRVGSKVLINHGGFLSWIDERGGNLRPVSNVSDPKVATSRTKYGDAPTVPAKSREAESRPAALDAEPFNSVTQKDHTTAKSTYGSRRRT